MGYPYRITLFLRKLELKKLIYFKFDKDGLYFSFFNLLFIWNYKNKHAYGYNIFGKEFKRR